MTQTHRTDAATAHIWIEQFYHLKKDEIFVSQKEFQTY